MSDTIARNQVQTALEFLEWCHGESLRRPWSDEAHAYYTAIDILEAALNEDLLPPEDVPMQDWQQAQIQQSRIARNEGYGAATLIHERYKTDYNQTTFVNRLLARFSQLLVSSEEVNIEP